MNVAYYSKGRGVIASFITVPPTSHLSWCLAGTVRKPGFHSFLRKAKSNVHNLKGFWVRCSSGADCLAALFVVYLFPPFSSWNSPVRLGWTASKTSLYLPGTGITSHTIMPQGFFGGGVLFWGLNSGHHLYKVNSMIERSSSLFNMYMCVYISYNM